MRIAFSGTANTGKTTIINNFLAVWSQYKTPEKTYRDIIKEKNLPHSSSTTTDTQWDILNFMIDQLQSLMQQPQKLDGSIVLMHVGTDPRRKEKFYHQLPALIDLLQKNQFTIKRIDELLQ